MNYVRTAKRRAFSVERHRQLKGLGFREKVRISVPHSLHETCNKEKVVLICLETQAARSLTDKSALPVLVRM